MPGTHPGERTNYEPSAREVLAAVESLYSDQLKPLGCLVLKRLRERLADEAAHRKGIQGPVDQNMIDTMPRINPKFLKHVCEESPVLRVQTEENFQYSALLVNREECFVDVTSSTDAYTREFWDLVAESFASLPPSDWSLPGGRYACARQLWVRAVPWSFGYSLGQLCHILQLAIVQKKLLGYRDGHIVPYQFSQDFDKVKFDARQTLSPPKSLGPGAYHHPSWEETQHCLRELLVRHGEVTLSNVKRALRAEFSVDLSETLLGHNKLTDLLADPRLQGVCGLVMRENGQRILCQPQVFVPAFNCHASGTLPVQESSNWRVPIVFTGAQAWNAGHSTVVIPDPSSRAQGHALQGGVGAWWHQGAAWQSGVHDRTEAARTLLPLHSIQKFQPPSPSGRSSSSESTADDRKNSCDLPTVSPAIRCRVKNTFIDVPLEGEEPDERRRATAPAEFHFEVLRRSSRLRLEELMAKGIRGRS